MTDPDYFYYDMTLTNFFNNSNQNIPITFSETRSQNLLNKSENYKMSIVRFQIDTYPLPSYYANIVPNQNNANLMLETVTVEGFDNTGLNPISVGSYTENLVWSPENINSQIPLAPSLRTNGFQDLDTDYYYGYSFKHFIDIFNNALREALDDLITANNNFTNCLAPFLDWDESNKLAKLYVHKNFAESFSTRPNYTIKIYINSANYTLFNSFHFKIYNYDKYEIVYYRPYSTSNAATFFAGNKLDEYNDGTNIWVTTEQEYSTISNWSPIQSVLFTSNTLPIVSNAVSNPSVFINNSQLSGGTNNQSARIITDIATNDMVYKPNLLYTPSGEYRFISLTGGAINKIDVTISWRDRYGFIRPMFLRAGVSCSIKFLFQKKNIN